MIDDPRGPDGQPHTLRILMAVVSELGRDFVGFLLAGLPMVLAAFAAIVAVYLIPVLGALPGYYLDMPNLAMAGMAVGAGVAIVGAGVSISLLYASLYRAAWAHIVDGEPLGFSAMLSRPLEDAGPVIVLTALIAGLRLIGLSMCLFPVFIVSALTELAFAGLIVHRLSPVAAIRQSVSHGLRYPAWTVLFFAISFLVQFVSSYLPLIGICLGVVMHALFVLRVYRAIYGSGDAPVEIRTADDGIGG